MYIYNDACNDCYSLIKIKENYVEKMQNPNYTAPISNGLAVNT